MSLRRGPRHVTQPFLLKTELRSLAIVAGTILALLLVWWIAAEAKKYF